MEFPDNVAILDLETILRCPVCFELPPPPILLCKRGHHVCQKCSQMLPNCPTCTASLTTTRSFLAEDLIQKMDFLHTNLKRKVEEEGKEHFSKKTKLEANTEVIQKYYLPLGLFKCPLEGCKDGTRPAEGIGGMLKHIRKIHYKMFNEFKNTAATFTTSFTLPYKKQKFHQRAFRISHLGLFFLNVRVLGDNNVNCFLQIVATESVAKRYEYEIVVSNSQQSFSFIDEVPPLVKEFNWLLQRGRVMIIQAKENNFLGSITVKVTIVMKKNQTE